MSNLPVDRDENYMKEMWGTTKLITDYQSDQNLKKIEEIESEPFVCGGSHFTHGHGFFSGRVENEKNSKFLQEIIDYKSNHSLKTQTELHESIRNDDDYDDWSYGTEPSYGKKW